MIWNRYVAPCFSIVTILASACSSGGDGARSGEERSAESAEHAVIAPPPRGFPANFPPSHDDACSKEFPVPSDWEVFSCKAADYSNSTTRCHETVTDRDCDGYIKDTFSQGLMTLEARDWNAYWGWCPISAEGRIQAICPRASGPVRH